MKICEGELLPLHEVPLGEDGILFERREDKEIFLINDIDLNNSIILY